MPVAYGSLPFPEAIKYFRNKLNVPTERWVDVWREGHNSAFMVAGALKDDLLNDFRRIVDLSIAEGKSITWLKKEFKKIVARHGWSHTGDATWRSDIIYSTNMRQSYNAGRWEQLQHFDYWLYKHGDSVVPRPMHLSWDGLLLPKNDKWWKTHMPQNGWNCKCKAFGRSQALVDSQNLKVSNVPNDGFIDWTDKVTGEVHKVPRGIDPGFDFVPQISTLQKQQKKLATTKAKVYTPPPRIAPTAFSTVKGVDVHSLNKLLDDLKQTPAAAQIAWLGEFLNQHKIKTLFIKEKEMGKGKSSHAIKDEVADYLGVKPFGSLGYYTIFKKHKPAGFTSIHFNHLVINVKSNNRFSKIEIVSLLAELNQIIKTNKKNWYTFNEARGYDSHDAVFLTWLHELGHQVYFKAGSPARPTSDYLTSYGNQSDSEWFAEHFVAYILAREQLAEQWQDTAIWFDDILNKVLKP